MSTWLRGFNCASLDSLFLSSFGHGSLHALKAAVRCTLSIPPNETPSMCAGFMSMAIVTTRATSAP